MLHILMWEEMCDRLDERDIKLSFKAFGVCKDHTKQAVVSWLKYTALKPKEVVTSKYGYREGGCFEKKNWSIKF